MHRSAFNSSKAHFQHPFPTRLPASCAEKQFLSWSVGLPVFVDICCDIHCPCLFCSFSHERSVVHDRYKFPRSLLAALVLSVFVRFCSKYCMLQFVLTSFGIFDSRFRHRRFAKKLSSHVMLVNAFICNCYPHTIDRSDVEVTIV